MAVSTTVSSTRRSPSECCHRLGGTKQVAICLIQQAVAFALVSAALACCFCFRLPATDCFRRFRCSTCRPDADRRAPLLPVDGLTKEQRIAPFTAWKENVARTDY